MPGPDLADDVRLLRDFANSLDVEQGTDSLDSPAALTRWLADHELLSPIVDPPPNLATPNLVTTDELALALRLRAALRQAMDDHEHGRVRALPELDAVAARLPLRISYAVGRPRLRPMFGGVSGALAAIMAAVARADADGSWRRLKLCEADDCRWAFYDTSKNRSRHWCSMGVCGNRNKARAWRARQRGT